MEVTQTSDAQLLITGAGGEQPLIMSAEDAAQFLAQAGLQLADIGDSERIIIGEARGDHQEVGLIEGNGVMNAESLLSAGSMDGSEVAGEINDGTVLYIDPNDPQAAAILQQAGLTLAEDGTVQSIEDAAKMSSAFENGNNGGLSQDYFMASNVAQNQHQQQQQKKEPMSIVPDVKGNEYGDSSEYLDNSSIDDRSSSALEDASTLAAMANQDQSGMNTSRAQTTTVPASAIQVGPDQQQVFYTVTGEDNKTQQYMMLCPKDMDQNTLIQTLVRQISQDPTSRGKKTIRITQQKKSASSNFNAKPPRVTPAPRVMALPRGAAAPARGRKPPPPQAQPVRQPQPQHQQQQQQVIRGQSQQEINRKIGEMLTSQDLSQAREAQILDTNTGNFETMQADASGYLTQQPQMSHTASVTDNVLDLAGALTGNETRVFVRCNYCVGFRSPLNGDTWESILNHILPARKEELQTTFYGDLNKHFIRSTRIQINGKQAQHEILPDPTLGNSCELILTHSLVCRKTKREFIISNPDANYVANLAKHIRMTQPGQMGRGNSLLCIFCNSPFTFEDYLRHIQPHIEAILATLNCFAGAYCTSSYEVLRARNTCMSCQEPESADLRFLPCTKFSTEYHCLSKLQFGIDCFRENYGENGFLRLNTNNLAKCSVCKNPQQVYCVVFHVTSTLLGTGSEVTHNIDSQICVCVNCQKQFINIVMKEQGFDERMKLYQLRNMEQLCSCFRVILGQVKAICQDKKTLIYSVHENTSNANSTVHTVKGAEVSELTPVTKLLALPEGEIASSTVKAFFVCDLCMFTVDLTSLVATPTNKQKNEMLLSIILEHVVPHTDSLMTVIASSAAVRTFNLKFEISSNVTELANTGQRKIVLSLRKKFQSQLGNNAEVILDKDEEVTINGIRSAVKSERKSYVSVRKGLPGEGPETPPTITTTTTASSSQQVEINKFIDKQRSKFGVWWQSGCNTTLLNTYIECRLCSKYGFPDFRLGSTGIEMCENCVETVLTLCLPSEPECLELPEECLALKDERNIGHRLVLASDLKKWLSLDGVNLIKKTVEEFDRLKSTECTTIFSDGIRQHLLAALKTCQNDEDITTAVAGFSITDEFLSTGNYGTSSTDSETAAALASLQEQVGMPIKQVEEKKTLKERQIEVKILARRPPNSTKKTPIPIRFGPKFGANIKRVIKNGTVIDLGSPQVGGQESADSQDASRNLSNMSAAAARKGDDDDSSQEESVSAIRSFLEETSPEKSTTTIIDGKEVRVPAGIKITSAGKGVVNIRAITDTRAASSFQSSSRPPITPVNTKTASPPAQKPTSVRGMKGVSMVTLTAGGIIKKVSGSDAAKEMLSDEDYDDEDDDDEGDSDDIFDEDFEEKIPKIPVQTLPMPKKRAVGGRVGKPADVDLDDDDYKPPPGAVAAVKAKLPKKIPILKAGVKLSEDAPPISPKPILDSSAHDDSAVSSSGEEPRSKRARKEKKIFDL